MEFSDELAVSEALKLDRSSLDGRPVFVSKCEDKRSKPASASFKVSTGGEENLGSFVCLFVWGNPWYSGSALNCRSTG